MATVTVTNEMDFDDLMNFCWRGAVDTLKVIEDNGKQDELMFMLSDLFSEGATLTEINDYLWFDDDFIFADLGISDDEDDEDEGEEE